MTSMGPTRASTKKAKSAEIELLTFDYLTNGGKVTELPTEHVQSNYKPAWTQYQAVAFEDADGEDRA